MQIVQERFPTVVKYCNGPDPYGHDHTGDELASYMDTFSPGAIDREYPSTLHTIRGMSLRLALCDYLGLPYKYKMYFKVQPFCDSNDEEEYGIAIGSNYVGVLNDAHYAKLKALFCPNEDAKWYLDWEKWKWRREYPSATKGEHA